MKPPPRLVPVAALERLALEFEIGFFESVLARDRDHLGALEALASVYPRAGRVADGLDVDRRLVALLPQNPVAHYNLACSLSLAGELDAAFEALERALALGYKDLDFLGKDPDLATLRRDRRFRALIARQREKA